MAINIQQSIISEVADFLVSQPTLEEMANYQIPEGVQHRLDDLLGKNRERGLTAEERLEAEKILTVVDLMDIVKIKAKIKLVGKR